MEDQEEWFYKSGDDWIGPITKDDLRTLIADGELTGDIRVAYGGMYNEGIPFKDIDAKYHVFQTGSYRSFYSEEDLWSSLDEGEINPESKLISPELGIHNDRVDSLKKSPLNFDPSTANLLKTREGKPITIFSGPNNSGKTLLLKSLQLALGRTAYLILPSRFQHMNNIGHSPFTEQQSKQLYSSFVTNFLRQNQNDDTNRLNLQQIFGGLSTEQQDTLAALVSDLLDIKITLKQSDPKSRVSPWFIDFGGQDFSVSSSGTRLLFLLLATCMLPRYTDVLIDEPELGLSPKIQGKIAKLLLDPAVRKKNFPHLERVWIATHSHIFLDKLDITNNFIIKKTHLDVDIAQISNFAEFHHLQFEMLGNDLTALFLPSAIVVVEGQTDSKFIERVFRIRYQDKRITTIKAGGDGVKNIVNTLKQTFGNIQSSPYGNRILVVLDSVNSTSKRSLINLGVEENNIIEWSKNGIEYFYPASILAELFGCGIGEAQSAIQIQNDVVVINGMRKRKTELAEEVVARLKPDTIYEREFEDKLLSKIERLVS